jgi:hypothetical protein
MSSWIYEPKKGEGLTIISSVDDPVIPKGAIGFIYKIVTHDGKAYIGKKNLKTKRKRRFGKREIAALTDKRKKHWEYVIKDSDWLTYIGSNKQLQKDIAKGVKYEKYILDFAFTKKHLTYLETKELFVNEVLESDEWYNDNILGKIFRKDVIKE